MNDVTHDQKPQGWSAGATGYESAFAPFSAMYSADAIRLLGLKEGDRFLDVCAGTSAGVHRIVVLDGEEIHPAAVGGAGADTSA